MSDSGTKTQLELVAVDGPAMTRCRNDGCDGHVHWLHDDEMPKCKLCNQVHWFREVADDKAAVTDAQTTAMLEGVVESAKRGAARGAARGAGGKPGKIAEASFVTSRWHVYIGKHDIAACVGEAHANTVADLINKAHGCEEATP